MLFSHLPSQYSIDMSESQKSREVSPCQNSINLPRRTLGRRNCQLLRSIPPRLHGKAQPVCPHPQFRNKLRRPDPQFHRRKRIPMYAQSAIDRHAFKAIRILLICCLKTMFPTTPCAVPIPICPRPASRPEQFTARRHPEAECSAQTETEVTSWKMAKAYLRSPAVWAYRSGGYCLQIRCLRPAISFPAE